MEVEFSMERPFWISWTYQWKTTKTRHSSHARKIVQTIVLIKGKGFFHTNDAPLGHPKTKALGLVLE